MVKPTYHAFSRCASNAAGAIRRPSSRHAAVSRRNGVLIRALKYASLLLVIASSAAFAQSAEDLVAAGDRESDARHPAQAVQLYERAIALEPTNYQALCNASRELVDLGEVEKNDKVRNEFYARALDYARRAVAVNPNDAEGHFHIARSIGRTALTLGPRDRVKLANEVRAQALRTLELDPHHAGALHIMGVWNAEVMRLNGLTRVIAKTILGGKVMDSASWAEAVRYMDLSVVSEPNRLVHRLDQARVYRDVGRKDDARKAYEAAIALPLSSANDDVYKRAAQEELKKLDK
jgi:tetratricopeptide (TPR) repeat protein